MLAEWRKFLGMLIAALGCFSPSRAAEVGSTVVAKTFTKIELQNAAVDTVGPGQLLKVLAVNGNKLQVSRGQPGWILESSVVPLDKAEQHFNRAFATGAGSADYLARGNVRIATGKINEGLADLKRAVELAGSDKLPYLEALGYGHLKAHDQVAALAAFDQALKLKAAASTLMGRGLAYYQMGRLDEAASDFQKAIEQNAKQAFPRKYLAVVLHDQGKLPEAKQQIESALQIDPNDSFAHIAAGRLYYDLKNYDDALLMFDRALTLDRSDVEAIVGRGVVLHAIGKDLAGAKATFESAIKLSKPEIDSAYLWSNLGQVETELGLLELALKNLSQAIEIDPLLLEARSHRAWLIGKHFSDEPQKLEQAKEDLRLVFRNQSETRTFWDYRALALLNRNLGNSDLANKAEAHALSVGDTAPKRFVDAFRASLAH